MQEICPHFWSYPQVVQTELRQRDDSLLQRNCMMLQDKLFINITMHSSSSNTAHYYAANELFYIQCV